MTNYLQFNPNKRQIEPLKYKKTHCDLASIINMLLILLLILLLESYPHRYRPRHCWLVAIRKKLKA